jgi:hypothetical protein
VKFSDNPKLNTILAHQNVAFLAQALDDSASGEAARQTLKESGITFDGQKAAQLQKDVEIASVALAQAKRVKDANGNALNPIELNKATSQFKKTTEAWQKFAKEIIDPMARLVSTGTAEDTKKAVEKIKVAPKARPQASGTPTQASKPAPVNPYQYGTQDYYAHQADEIIRAKEAQKARAYA